MLTYFKLWKLSRMKTRLQLLEAQAEHWRNEQQRLALAAYHIPDMMNEPLRWGRLQNAANWAGHHRSEYQTQAIALRNKIDVVLTNAVKEHP